MKKIFLSVILSLLTFSSKAQQYHPLVDSDAIWSGQSWATDWFDLGLIDYEGYKFILSGDTFLQGKHYLLLKYRKTYYYEYIQGGPPYVQNAMNINDTYHLMAGLREDSDKKVYVRMFINNFWVTLPPDVDTLLYNFNLQQGDTFHLNSSLWAIVESIDSIQLMNGEWRKQFHFNTNCGWSTLVWIEGIGSDGGPLGNYIFVFESGMGLTCYKRNNELLYESVYISSSFPIAHLTCDSIDIPTGIEHFNESVSCHIYPNPVSDVLSINYSSTDFSAAQLKITNVLGRLLWSNEIQSGTPLQIPVNEFSFNNIVFCQLWQNGNMVGVKKILIQK